MKLRKDSNIPDRVWNLYLKKYSNKYLVRKDEIGIWHIRCKYGLIQLFSHVNHLLLFVGDFRSQKHKTWFKKKIINKKCRISTEGDADISLVFDEKFLHSMADSLNIIKKKKISESHRRLLIERIKHAREARKH
ncbi:MAG: hypothetical protein JSW60_09365 [Thermoplasmatales archaeon]|nr:MAG: hypothetical protein JSW60_09365 [Thermoplasmatales archaeon]